MALGGKRSVGPLQRKEPSRSFYGGGGGGISAPPATSSSTISYKQSPAPVADPFNEQRYAGMAAAAATADPYAKYRSGWLNQLQTMAAGGPGSFTPSDPSYAFRFKQGQGAVESSLAAQGLLGSGRAALELQEYGQGAASQEFAAQFSRLQQLAGMGDPVAAANLQQQAVEGRYRTYLPQMMETGRTGTESGGGYGGGYSGGGGGGGYGGSRSGGGGGGGGGGTSSVADFLSRKENMSFNRPGQMQAGGYSYTQGLLAARAQDIATFGQDTFPIEQMMPVASGTMNKSGNWSWKM